MVEWGIITASSFEDKTVYQLQKAYLDEQLLEDLSALLILYMQKMSKNMDFSQIKGSTTEAVIRNLFLFIRLFEAETTKKPFDKDALSTS